LKLLSKIAKPLSKIAKPLSKITKLLPKIRLPSPKKVESAVQELVILGGFIMVFTGLWGYDHRLALIICGLWLMWPAKSA